MTDHAFNATYVLAQVGWSALGLVLLVAAAVAWHRIERRIAARALKPTVVTFPRREATVTPLHRDAS